MLLQRLPQQQSSTQPIAPLIFRFVSACTDFGFTISLKKKHESPYHHSYKKTYHLMSPSTTTCQKWKASSHTQDTLIKQPAYVQGQIYKKVGQSLLLLVSKSLCRDTSSSLSRPRCIPIMLLVHFYLEANPGQNVLLKNSSLNIFDTSSLSKLRFLRKLNLVIERSDKTWSNIVQIFRS